MIAAAAAGGRQEADIFTGRSLPIVSRAHILKKNEVTAGSALSNRRQKKTVSLCTFVCVRARAPGREGARGETLWAKVFDFGCGLKAT